MIFLFYISTVSIYGLILLFAGFLLRLNINRRRFNRRSPTGLQHYPNYWNALFTTFMESAIGILAFLMIVAGLVVLLTQWYNQS